MIPFRRAARDPNAMTLWEHFGELRLLLIRILALALVAFCIAFTFHRELIAQLLAPVVEPAELLLLSPLDGFICTLKVSLWAAIAATSPLALALILRFILPALHLENYARVFPAFVVCALAALLGIANASFLLLPMANRFFFEFNASLGRNAWSLPLYLDYTALIHLSSVVACELVALVLWLVHTGALPYEFLSSKRRHALLAILILSAVLTPPDVFTQLLMAVPLYLSYECAILYGRWRRRRLC